MPSKAVEQIGKLNYKDRMLTSYVLRSLPSLYVSHRVLAGCIYSIFYQENFYLEQVPEAFAPPPYTRSLLGNAVVNIEPSVRMALAQLGSCYFLIMLNSALMFYALRRHVRDAAALERILRYLFVVLGAADWTHIGLTLYMLPSAPPRYAGRGEDSALMRAISKAGLLAHPASWNSLLFGNVIITFVLFCFRAAWWIGVGRQPQPGAGAGSGAALASKRK